MSACKRRVVILLHAIRFSPSITSNRKHQSAQFRVVDNYQDVNVIFFPNASRSFLCSIVDAQKKVRSCLTWCLSHLVSFSKLLLMPSWWTGMLRPIYAIHGVLCTLDAKCVLVNFMWSYACADKRQTSQVRKELFTTFDCLVTTDWNLRCHGSSKQWRNTKTNIRKVHTNVRPCEVGHWPSVQNFA